MTIRHMQCIVLDSEEDTAAGTLRYSPVRGFIAPQDHIANIPRLNCLSTRLELH